MISWKLSKSFNFKGRTVKWDSQGEGYPLVMAHGTPWSSFNLRHLIKGLSDAFKVFYFDLLGYGQSDQSEGDVSLAVQNEVLASLISYWGIDHPIAIGHDFGGTTVLRTHLLNNVGYGKLILIDPVALSPWGSPFFQHVRRYEKAFAGVPDYIHQAIAETYIKTAAFQKLDEGTMAGILKPWTTQDGKAAFYRQIAQADSRYTDEIQDMYSSMNTPTLILWGENDEWIPLEKGRQLKAMIPDSRLEIIPKSGHLVIEEEPDSLIREIKNFIKGET